MEIFIFTSLTLLNNTEYKQTWCYADKPMERNVTEGKHKGTKGTKCTGPAGERQGKTGQGTDSHSHSTVTSCITKQLKSITSVSHNYSDSVDVSCHWGLSSSHKKLAQINSCHTCVFITQFLELENSPWTCWHWEEIVQIYNSVQLVSTSSHM